MKLALELVERGLVPEALVRRGIRRLLGERLREEQARHEPDREAALRAWVGTMRSAAIAPAPEAANAQHYELPAAFFGHVLGRRRKYSSCFYPHAATTLDEAEEAMLALTAERAGLADGQDVLELGCGWGSLTLWLAERFPRSRVLAVSGSSSQRAHVLGEAALRGLANVEVVTSDAGDLRTERRFDRIVSIEMFEHLRNWEELLGRARGWLRDDGRLFLHVFAHRRYAYPFEVRDETDWMSRHFFTGGMMPSADLLERLEVPFRVEARWEVPGTHYARTAEDWRARLEASRAEVLRLFAATWGPAEARRWLQRWRVFFLACAELFGYAGGEEWLVVHARLAPADAGRGEAPA